MAMVVGIDVPSMDVLRSETAEWHLIEVWKRAEPKMSKLGEDTPTSGLWCEAPTGPILVRFASKVLESALVSGNMGHISIL